MTIRINRLMPVALVLVGWLLQNEAVWAESHKTGVFRLPPYEKAKLENGLTVYLMEQHEVPLIDVCVALPAGSVEDGDQYGLASLTADALLFGTKTLTKDRLEEILEGLGAQVNTSASRDFAALTLSFANKDQDVVFPILRDILTEPSLDPTEFDKRKKQALLELKRNKERPASVVFSYFSRALFSSHPYGNPVSGTEPAVAQLTLDDVKRFYREHVRPNGSAMAVVGDFQTPQMKRRINSLFRGWKPSVAPKAVIGGPIPVLDTSRVLIVNKEDATETRFVIGGFGIPRNHPDFLPVLVINTLFGGQFTSWLNTELRINRGLTYGVSSILNTYKTSGVLAVTSFTRTENTEEAIDVTLDVLNRLHKTGVDEATLQSAKNYLNGQYPPELETGQQLASLLTSMFVYGFGDEFINGFMKTVSEMTVEKTKTVVAAHFPEDRLQFVLIGKASAIRGIAKKYGEVQEKEIQDPGF